MDSVESRFSKPVFEATNPGDWSFCFQDISPAPEERGMEARPIEYSYRFPIASMESRKLLRFSPIFPHPPGVKQNTTQSYTYSDFDNTMLANSVIVSQSFEHIGTHATSHKKCPKAISRPIRETSPIRTEQYSYASGLVDFREKLSHRGISQQSTRFITKSRRTDSKSQEGNYKSAGKKWTSWHDRQETDPFQCSLNHVLEYLRQLFNNKNLEYCIIGVHRSALSAYHTYVDDKPVGQHPLVCSLISEIFNLLPPQPKYMFVWDVQVVLNYIKSKWGSTGKLPYQEVTLKLCMFLALTTSLTSLTTSS